MIKLKDLITESNRPTISSIDEQNALQLISLKLIPKIVKEYNSMSGKWGVPEITENEARKKLIKVRKERYANGEGIFYAIKLLGTIVNIVIQKLSFRKSDGDKKDEDIFEIKYYDFYDFTQDSWGNYGWNIYNVEDLIQGDFDLWRL